MNHDFAHCLDYNKERCPEGCFRAMLTKELEARPDLVGIPFTFAHFKGTQECAGAHLGFGAWMEDRTEYVCPWCMGSVKDEIVFMLKPQMLPRYCPYCGKPLLQELTDDKSVIK